MAEITREPGLNSGIPDNDGLDEGTRAALLAQAEKTGKGVLVGGTQDVQRFFGELAKDDSEETVNMPPGENKESPTSLEHDATTPGSGSDVASVSEDSTKEEIQAALDAQGIEYNTSDTKAELLERFNQ